MTLCAADFQVITSFTEPLIFVLNCHLLRFVPESPRWLVTEGRFEEALAILKDGAKSNNKALPSDSELMEMLTSIKAQVTDLT